MKIPVEQLVAGDIVILPNQREVTVEQVDRYPDDRWPDREPDGEILIVSWWRIAETGEPGAPRWSSDPKKPIEDHQDGRYLGSLKPMKPGELVEILERTLRVVA